MSLQDNVISCSYPGMVISLVAEVYGAEVAAMGARERFAELAET